MIKNIIIFSILSVVVFSDKNGITILFFLFIICRINANADNLDSRVDIDNDSFGMCYYFAVNPYNL